MPKVSPKFNCVGALWRYPHLGTCKRGMFKLWSCGWEPLFHLLFLYRLHKKVCFGNYSSKPSFLKDRIICSYFSSRVSLSVYMVFRACSETDDFDLYWGKSGTVVFLNPELVCGDKFIMLSPFLVSKTIKVYLDVEHSRERNLLRISAGAKPKITNCGHFGRTVMRALQNPSCLIRFVKWGDAYEIKKVQ